MKSYFDDAGLLGILEDDFTSKRKIENSPPKKAVYQFGRPKTPDIQSNKSKGKIK